VGVLSSSMYSWMIVYSVSSTSQFLIARKVMPRRIPIIFNNMPRLQPKAKATASRLVRLGIGGVSTSEY